MDGQHTIPTHYAILIGINAYPSRPLGSCVRDVQKIKEYLESKLASIDVQTLTASGGESPLEHPERWPTRNNVTSALETTTSRARPGDFIYIHYSGHGTRRDPDFGFSNQSTGDLALVLLDGDTSREVFLLGPRLAGLLKAMVDKGLVVTLVLDCCFSASVYRSGDPNIRYFPCNSPAASTYLAGSDSVTGDDTRSANRNASMRDNWLLNPGQYTILAACGPHENAKGGSEASEKGERYGALSYFLLKALSDHGLERRHRDIHRHLCAKFWETGVVQHPVLYGNENQAFFGPVDSYRNARSTSIVKRDESLRLLTGLAHGLRNGDHFALSPLGPTSDRDAEGAYIAKVIRIGPLTSELEMLGTPRSLQTGWIAEPLTCVYLADFPVRLAPELPRQGEWLAALKQRSLAPCVEESQVPALQVVLSNDEYKILNASCREIINLPIMPREQTDAHRICDTLEHLSRFSMAKNLTNETTTAIFQNLFDIQISTQGTAFGLGEQIEVQHGSIVKLTIENLGDTVLYAHVYNLGPFWQVKGMLRGTYEAIPPRNGDQGFTGIFLKKIQMTVPPVMHKYGSCEDIIKVFVTSQPTSFESLELPNLGELASIRTLDRASHPSGYGSEDWVALSFSIRTSL
ncbi:putative caspase [Trichoderma ceciliae]